MSGLFWHGPSLRRLFEAKHKDLARSIPALKKGHGGKQRSQMPQVDDPAAFVQWLASEKHIPFTLDSVESGSLTPTQKHFSTEKVQEMAKNAMDGKFPKISDPIIVSADLKILDGHHRWAALRAMSPKNPIKIYRVSTTIEKLMSLARQFGARSENLHKKAFVWAALSELEKLSATMDQLQQAYNRINPTEISLPAMVRNKLVAVSGTSAGGALSDGVTTITPTQHRAVILGRAATERSRLAAWARGTRSRLASESPPLLNRIGRKLGLIRSPWDARSYYRDAGHEVIRSGISANAADLRAHLYPGPTAGTIKVTPGVRSSAYPVTPGIARADKLMTGIHEGFERQVRPQHIQPVHSHASPTVLINEHNMLKRFTDPSAPGIRREWRAMRRASNEGKVVTDAARSVGGNRAARYVARHGFTKAMKKRIKRNIAAKNKAALPAQLAAANRLLRSGDRYSGTAQ